MMSLNGMHPKTNKMYMYTSTYISYARDAHVNIGRQCTPFKQPCERNSTGTRTAADTVECGVTSLPNDTGTNRTLHARTTSRQFTASKYNSKSAEKRLVQFFKSTYDYCYCCRHQFHAACPYGRTWGEKITMEPETRNSRLNLFLCVVSPGAPLARPVPFRAVDWAPKMKKRQLIRVRIGSWSLRWRETTVLSRTRHALQHLLH